MTCQDFQHKPIVLAERNDGGFVYKDVECEKGCGKLCQNCHRTEEEQLWKGGLDRTGACRFCRERMLGGTFEIHGLDAYENDI